LHERDEVYKEMLSSIEQKIDQEEVYIIMDQKLAKEEANIMQIELREELLNKFDSYDARLKGTVPF
jgi:Ca2+-binding EF-hand superfamily protein